MHGGSPAEGGLQRERLRAIAEAVNVPLVLHGASGLGDDDLNYAVGQRVAKINVGTSLHEAFARGMAAGLAAGPPAGRPERPSDPRRALRAGEASVLEAACALLNRALGG